MPDELAAILAVGRFRNAPGLEVKYFALSLAGATLYAAQAAARFGDGPFTLVETSIPDALIAWPMEVRVDGGIPTLVVPTSMLKLLSPPIVIGAL